MKNKENKNKVLIIGLDGACWELLDPWIRQDMLPTLKKLRDEGLWGDLKSVTPTLSAPAWVSFMTGKNPEKHGVFNFAESSNRNHKSDSEARIVSSNSFKDKTLWQILSENKKKVGVINVPVTYPPKKVNGFLISCFLTPPGCQNFTYPKELKNEIPYYKIDVDFERKWVFEDVFATEKVNRKSLIKEQSDVSRKRFKATIKLLERYDLDFLCLVFKGTDVMQHFFWHKKSVLLKYYQELDEYIKKIINKFSPSFVFIISDHGFGAAPRRVFYINTWLKENRFIQIKKNIWSSLIVNVGKILSFVIRHIELLKKLVFLFPKQASQAIKTIQAQIDWKKTKAYVNKDALGLYILDTKRQGQLKKHLISKLKSIKDPKTGDYVFQDIVEKEKIYAKAHNIENLADLVLFPNTNFVISPDFSEKVYSDFKTIRTGDHNNHPQGIFIGWGNDIKNSKNKFKNLNLIDITPTILHIFGLPLEPDLDGRVLKEIFREDSDYSKREIFFKDLSEKEKIKEQIRHLNKI